MARKRITMNGVPTVEAIGIPIIQDKEQKDSFYIGEFLKLHEQFMTVKKLEGLAEKMAGVSAVKAVTNQLSPYSR